MGEGIDRMKEWFGRALRAADFDLKLQDKEKGSGWKEATPLFLFNKMMGHVNKMMDSNPRVGQVHAIKVVNYALMVATRITEVNSPPLSDIELKDLKLAEEERAKGEMPVFDSIEELLETPMGVSVTPEEIEEISKEGTKEPPKAEPEKIVLREIIYPHTGHTESSNVEWGPPIIAGEPESEPSEEKAAQWAKIEAEKAFEAEMERKAEPDPIIETGLPPLDLGPLPNGPAKEAFSTAQVDTAGDLLKADLRGLYEPNGSEDASYYCPWCEHTAKLGEACRGKVCCVKCGKPINSRMGKLLKKAREGFHVKTKTSVSVRKMAEYLGTTASWAGQVMRALGWTRNAYYGGYPTIYTPPKEDGK